MKNPFSVSIYAILWTHFVVYQRANDSLFNFTVHLHKSGGLDFRFILLF